MSAQYCEEHNLIELEDGKCVACGEVEYLTEEQQQMSDKTRIKWIVFVYGIFFTIFAGFMYFTV